MTVNVENWVRSSPVAYGMYCMITGNRRDILVDKNTDVVLEGFGGSGNTFFLRAFTLPQIYPYRIAHHVHTPSQVLKGVKLGKPIILIVRDPSGSVKSLVTRKKRQLSASEIKAESKKLLERYIDYHNKVKEISDSVVVADFEESKIDFGRFMELLNRKFDKNYIVFKHSEENVKYIQSHQKTAKPGTERLNSKADVELAFKDPDLSKLLRRADELYEEFKKKSEAQIESLSSV